MIAIQKACTVFARLCVTIIVCSGFAAHASPGDFSGHYIVGDNARRITVTPIPGSPRYKVQFKGEAKARIYFSDGGEKQTQYSDLGKHGTVRSKFVLRHGAGSGYFINEKGKKEKVTRGK